MISVQNAEDIILQHTREHGVEHIPFEVAAGRVLAEDIVADRDLPPCNRATMDGIAISYAAFSTGARTYRIKATIAAGTMPEEIGAGAECIEIMTGAGLPDTADTVVRYEDLQIANSTATITIDAINKGQNIHRKGKDKKKDDVVAYAGQYIDAAVVSMAASVGKSELLVKKLPRVVVIATGNELVAVDTIPSPYQVRSSNSYTVRAVLQQYCIQPELLHIPDDAGASLSIIGQCLRQYDVLILSGGVSMGKFDYVPDALNSMNVKKLFHKVQQRPGKPFWFGVHGDGAVVFAFPGNPVSTFLCLQRYFIPWLYMSQLGKPFPELCAALNEDFSFNPQLQYFLQVKLSVSKHGQVLATPVEGNGSGDFANLLDSDAFIELPMEQTNFKKGEVYRIWPFKRVI